MEIHEFLSVQRNLIIAEYNFVSILYFVEFYRQIFDNDSINHRQNT